MADERRGGVHEKSLYLSSGVVLSASPLDGWCLGGWGWIVEVEWLGWAVLTTAAVPQSSDCEGGVREWVPIFSQRFIIFSTLQLIIGIDLTET